MRQRPHLQGAPERWIAGKQLVAAKTGKRNGNARVSHGFRNDESVDAIHRRLIEGSERSGKHFIQPLLAELNLMMIGVEFLGNAARVGSLGKLLLSKNYAECLWPLVGYFTHQGHDGA